MRLRPVAARNRDVELGVAPHAVLVDVESTGLDLRLDADAHVFFRTKRIANDSGERERADRTQAERLDAELVEAAAVEEPGRPVARLFACDGSVRKPSASVPQTPAIPCAATAPIGSSIPTRSTRSTPKTTITPATKPITIAAHGATNAQAAVIATSAAIAPFSIIEMSGFLITSQDVTSAPRTPAAAAMFVFSAT